MLNKVAVVVGILVLSTIKTAEAQINPENTTLQMYTNCFNYAIQNNLVRKSGESIVFYCYHDVARVFFDTLGRYGNQTSQQRWSSGIHLVRLTDPTATDKCWHQTSDAYGNSVSSHGCSLYFFAGPFINR